MSEQVRYVTADRAHIGALQLESGELVQFVEAESAVDREFVSVDFLELGFLHVELILNIADQFLEHVFERDHADGTSKFVDHDREVRVFAQKKIQQLFQRHHFWNRN